jgi:hypothetical protein
MSIEVKIELSAAMVVAIQEAAEGHDVEALRAVHASHALTDRAVFDAIKDLPYDLTPKDAAPEQALGPNRLKRSTSLNSETSTEAPKTKRQGKTRNRSRSFSNSSAARQLLWRSRTRLHSTTSK